MPGTTDTNESPDRNHGSLSNSLPSAGDDATHGDVDQSPQHADSGSHAWRSQGDQSTYIDTGSSIPDLDDGLEEFDDGMEIVDLAGRYEFQELLGRGGMGEVWKAIDTRLKRTVAIKRVLGKLSRSRRALQRFMSEAQSIAAFNHYNVVQVYDYGRDADGPFLILEYVDGMSLKECLQNVPLPLAKAVEITTHICDALQAAHDRGIIHRDIKPANVLLNAEGTAKVSDFGLARQAGNQGQETRTGAVIGTPDYMAPEQRQNASKADARSDQWSAAATFYQMITGEVPRVISVNALPESVRDVVARALHGHPHRRYASISEFSLALQDATVSVADASEAGRLEDGQCGECGRLNDLSRSFCRDCGESLSIPCPECQAQTPLWERFCGQCGQDVPSAIEAQLKDAHALQRQIVSLRQEYGHRDALEKLELLLRTTHPSLEPSRQWASEAQSRLQAELDDLTGQRELSHAAAVEAAGRGRFLAAIRDLEQIPAVVASDRTRSLIEQFTRAGNEVRSLATEIRAATQARDYDTLTDRLPQYLHLRPYDEKAQRLLTQAQKRRRKLPDNVLRPPQRDSAPAHGTVEPTLPETRPDSKPVAALHEVYSRNKTAGWTDSYALRGLLVFGVVLCVGIVILSTNNPDVPDSQIDTLTGLSPTDVHVAVNRLRSESTEPGSKPLTAIGTTIIETHNGATVTITASSTVPVVRAWIEFFSASSTSSFSNLPMEVDGRRLTAKWIVIANANGQLPDGWRIVCETQDGRKNVEKDESWTVTIQPTPETTAGQTFTEPDEPLSVIPDKLQTALDSSATVAFVDISLKEAIDRLARIHEVSIRLDKAALGEVGILSDKPVNLAVDRITLRSVLHLLSRPLNLMPVVDGDTIRIIPMKTQGVVPLAPTRPDSAASQRANNALQEQTNFDFIDTPFFDALRFLSALHDAPIVIDDWAVNDEGVQITEPLNHSSHGGILGVELNSLLAPLKLTHVVNDEVIMITSQKKAEADHPKLLETLAVHRAYALMTQDETRDALTQITDVRTPEGNLFYLNYHEAAINALAGRSTQAIDLYHEFIDAYGDQNLDHPFVRQTVLNLSQLYFDQEEYDKSITVLKALRDLRPDDAGLNNDLGYRYASLDRDLDTARKLIQSAVDTDPNEMAYVDSLGWVLYKQGDFLTAKQHLTRAATHCVTGVCWDHLGDCHNALNDADQARAAWDRAMELAQVRRPLDRKLIAQVAPKLKLSETDALAKALTKPAVRFLQARLERPTDEMKSRSVSALMLLALLECGSNPLDEAITKSLELMTASTTDEAAPVAFLTKAIPHTIFSRKVLRDLSAALEAGQIKVDHGKGLWNVDLTSSYSGAIKPTGLVLSALATSEAQNIPVSVETWGSAGHALLKTQQPDGGWPVATGMNSVTTYPEPTLLALAGLALCERHGGVTRSELQSALHKGIAYLEKQRGSLKSGSFIAFYPLEFRELEIALSSGEVGSFDRMEAINHFIDTEHADGGWTGFVERKRSPERTAEILLYLNRQQPDSSPVPTATGED